MSDTVSVTVTTVVAVDPATAFEVFTDEIDAWWKTGPRYRVENKRKSSMRFTGGAGGRLLEEYDAAGDDAFEHGRVLVWEPADRLVFQMGGRDCEPARHLLGADFRTIHSRFPRGKNVSLLQTPNTASPLCSPSTASSAR